MNVLKNIITEQQDLDYKIAKLKVFIKENPNNRQIELLKDQLNVMKEYWEILEQRILDFNNAD
jgi:DNA-binding transcriptional MerR regulator